MGSFGTYEVTAATSQRPAQELAGRRPTSTVTDPSAPKAALIRRPARSGCRRAHLLEVNGAPARRRVSRDAYGNVVAWLHADRVTQAIEFRLAAVIERVCDDGPTLRPRRRLTAQRRAARG